MNILIRVDASNNIGGGHVLRCLDLAHSLKKNVSKIEFLCNPLMGNSIKKIKNHGFIVHSFTEQKNISSFSSSIPHSKHLGVSWKVDCQQTINFLQEIKQAYDMIIIDHYALDFRWEKKIRSYIPKIMVIDDLANRKHDCDLILDQVFQSSLDKYKNLLPKNCSYLFGSKYILLNIDFFNYRNRKDFPKNIKNNNMHLFFGTNDKSGYTIRFSKLILKFFPEISLKIAISGEFLFYYELEKLSKKYKNRLNWKSDINNMASHMLECSYAIGSPGMSTWERLCMGLPTMHLTNTKLQINILKLLKKSGICEYLGHASEITDNEFVSGLKSFLENKPKLMKMREIGLTEIDGQGINRVTNYILNELLNEK